MKSQKYLIIRVVVDMCGVAGKRWTNDKNVTGLRSNSLYFSFLLLYIIKI